MLAAMETRMAGLMSAQESRLATMVAEIVNAQGAPRAEQPGSRLQAPARAGLKAFGMEGPMPMTAQLAEVRLELDLDQTEGQTGGIQIRSAPQGSEKKEQLERKFHATPMNKYQYVMRAARRELGTELSAMTESSDAATIRRYFRDCVPLGKYKLATHMLELIVEIHRAVRSKDESRALGLIAGSYQFLEQYAVDGADVYHGWIATHLPNPQAYPAQGFDDPVGRLMEREVTSAATALDTEMERCREHKQKRAARNKADRK